MLSRFIIFVCLVYGMNKPVYITVSRQFHKRVYKLFPSCLAFSAKSFMLD